MLFQLSEKDMQFLIELGQRACKSSFENLHFSELTQNIIKQSQDKNYDVQMQKLQKIIEDQNTQIIEFEKKEKKKK